jgi:hypothetical protein
MAIHTHLHSSREPAEKGRQEEQLNPGLWKLIVATATILVLAVGSMEVFKETEKGLAFQRPAQGESNSSLQ